MTDEHAAWMSTHAHAMSPEQFIEVLRDTADTGCGHCRVELSRLLAARDESPEDGAMGVGDRQSQGSHTGQCSSNETEIFVASATSDFENAQDLPDLLGIGGT
jgi:hypothetical protein